MTLKIILCITFHFIGIWQRAVEAVFALIHVLRKVQSSIVTFSVRKIDLFHKQAWAWKVRIAHPPSACLWLVPGIEDGDPFLYVKASCLWKCQYP